MPDERDYDRELNERGHRDGSLMQDFYATHANPAEWIWSSSAKRAAQTADFVAQGFTATVTSAAELYLAGPEQLLDTLRATPPGVQSVAVIAHNPGMTHLANLLSTESITANLPTFGSVLFATEQDWPNLVMQHNHFVSLTTPKSIG